MSLLHREYLPASGIYRITLASAPGNVLDAPLMEELAEALESPPEEAALRALLLTAEGPHFCYGASVAEHRAEEISTALERLDRVVVAFLNFPAPSVVAMQGLCLGGGLELALACDLWLASENSEFACPEIELAVFPPAAAALLPARVGQGEAALLQLSGQRMSAGRAFQLGLVQELLENEGFAEAAHFWVEGRFAEKSASALRHAVAALRHGLRLRWEADWPRHRAAYLDGLMSEADPHEGVAAFLEKRSARFEHR